MEKKDIKIMVFGATGMAGHTIAVYFLEKGYDVLAITRKPIEFCRYKIVDLFNLAQVKKVILENCSDYIINCVGILNKEAENYKSDAVYLNAYFPHFLADSIVSSKTRLIHMSTDCVFSGKSGNYNEESLTDGQTFYDRTKAMGEIVDDRNLTFRNSIIGPDMARDGIGLFNWFMQQKGEINGYEKAIWNGVTTLTLARAMECAINNKLVGLYHLVGDKGINKYELLCLFNKTFKNNNMKINKVNGPDVNKVLKNNRKDFNFVVPSYQEMLYEEKLWIEQHEAFYLHYCK